MRIRINGREQPVTLRLTVGETDRLRLIHIIPDWTARTAMVRDDSTVHWRALAKDGAERPRRAQVVAQRNARVSAVPRVHHATVSVLICDGCAITLMVTL